MHECRYSRLYTVITSLYSSNMASERSYRTIASTSTTTTTTTSSPSDRRHQHQHQHQQQSSPQKSKSLPVTAPHAVTPSPSSSSFANGTTHGNGSSSISFRSKNENKQQPLTAAAAAAAPPPPPLLVSKEVRWKAAQDAALTGQYTRLKEHVVEAVSVPQEDRDNETTTNRYYLKSGMHIPHTNIRSSMFQIITEAAALGSMKTKKNSSVEWGVSSSNHHHHHNNHNHHNNDENENEHDSSPTSDNHAKNGMKQQLWEAMAASSSSSSSNNHNHNNHINKGRTSSKRRNANNNTTIIIITTTHDPTELVNTYVEFQQERRREEILDGAEQALERMEQHSVWGEQWKTMELELPTSVVPRFRKPVPFMTEGRLRGAIARGAAEMGSSRQERLVLEGKFKVHQTCPCVYCQRPSAFQTQAFQKLRMKQGWTDDSLQDESTHQERKQEETHNNQLGSRTKSRARSGKNMDSLSQTYHGPRRQTTLAAVLTDSTTTGRKSLELDPNLPSHFQATAASKDHIKAWKSRAAKAKRESYENAHAHAHAHNSRSADDWLWTASPVATPQTPQTGGGSCRNQGWNGDGTFVSPRSARKQAVAVAASSPVAAGPTNHYKTNPGWDHDTFVSPRSARKAKLNSLTSMSMHSPASKPIWAKTQLKKRDTTKQNNKDGDSSSIGEDRSETRPIWANGRGKEFLLSACSSPFVSPSARRKANVVDSLAMTEHSPFRGNTPTRKGGTTTSTPMRRSKSFDGDFDEELLLFSELDALDLSSESPPLQSPPRRTAKPSLLSGGPKEAFNLAAGNATNTRKQPSLPLDDDDDDDDDDDSSEFDTDDDFAY